MNRKFMMNIKSAIRCLIQSIKAIEVKYELCLSIRLINEIMLFKRSKSLYGN
jgi:hypothetical protein